MPAPLPKLSSLPTELIADIAAHLNAGDVLHLLLAGLGSQHAPTLRHLRRKFRRHVRALHTILRGLYPSETHTYFDIPDREIIQSAISRYALTFDDSNRLVNLCQNERLLFTLKEHPDLDPFYVSPPTPSSLSMRRAEFTISYPRPAVFKAIADEMPMLRCLVIRRGPDPEHVLIPQTFPLELGLCQQLRVLSLHMFELPHFPEAILRLRRLQVLELVSVHALHKFPREIGTRLPKLAYVNLMDCRVIRGVLHSLLETLERNFLETLKPPILKHGFHVHYGQIPSAFWDGMDHATLYPQLSKHIKKGCGAFHPERVYIESGVYRGYSLAGKSWDSMC